MNTCTVEPGAAVDLLASAANDAEMWMAEANAAADDLLTSANLEAAHILSSARAEAGKLIKQAQAAVDRLRQLEERHQQMLREHARALLAQAGASPAS